MSDRELTIHRNLVSSTTRPARRKTPAELRAMPHEARLMYEIRNPPSEFEREQEFLREGEIQRYLLEGEVLIGTALWDDGPPDPSEDYS